MSNLSEESSYVFIDIIGSNPDRNENSNKIDGYYQITNGILVSYFANNFLNIDTDDIKIYACGDEKNYNKFIHTNNKSYFQLDTENIFQIDIKFSQIVFNYFTNFDIILSEIEAKITASPFKSIVLFLDDHGSDGYFSKIEYFHLYKIIMKYPDNPFLILNDSCYSGSMINIIKSHYLLYNLKTKNIKSDKRIDLQVLFIFLNLIQYFFRQYKPKKLFNEVEKLIDFYQSIDLPEDIFKKIVNLPIKPDISSDVSIDEVCDFANELKQFGFSKVVDIKKFQKIVDIFKLNINEPNEKLIYKQSKLVLSKLNLELIEKISNNDLSTFIEVLDAPYLNQKLYDFEYPPHQNIEIISSTDYKHRCLSFVNIRTNKVTKVYPGSPAMGSFIKEIFLKSDEQPLNFENIKKDISQINDNYIFFHGDVEKNERNGRKKNKWIHFYPEHYKQTKQDFTFHHSIDVKIKVAALRAISFLIVNKLKEIAKLLVPNDFNFQIKSSNDYMADVLSIIAIINSSKDKPNLFINNCIISNQIIKSRNLLGIKFTCLIIDFSFYFSDKPTHMAAAIFNCLEAAIQKVILEKLNSVSVDNMSKNSLKSLFTTTEIEKIIKKENNIEFVKDIENAIFSLLDPKSVFFGSFIALSLLSEQINYEKLIKSASFIPLLTKDERYQKFLLDKKIEHAECYLLSYVNSSINHLEFICNLQIKNDVMRFIAHQLQYINAISIMKILLENITNDEIKKAFISKIIDQIEKAISIKNISDFFIPIILANLPISILIYALYASIPNVKNNWYQETMNIIKVIQKNDIDENVYESIINIAEISLMNQINISTIYEYNEEVSKMESKIFEEIQKSIYKVNKLINISIIKARENIKRKINVKIILDQINEYIEFLRVINKNKQNNKFHKYLYSCISDLELSIIKVNEPFYSEVPTKGFEANSTLTDTKSLFERTANELYTASCLFNISDDSYYEHSKELSKKIPIKNSFDFSTRVMVARSFNIVEMAPITELLDTYKMFFEENDGKKANLKELMGLCSSNIHILSDRDESRIRFKKYKISNFKDSTTLNKFCEEEEIDYYYDEDYFEEKDSIPYRTIKIESTEEKTYLNKYPNFPFLQNLKYYDEQISLIKIEIIRKELDLGWNDWIYEIWLAFLYCFNDRMKKINIEFDSKNDYKNENMQIRIDNLVSIVTKFFPIQQIIDFGKNKEKIERFIGKYEMFKKEIFHSFILAFDDADRIVTPLHSFTETYEGRTDDTLKLIFESYK